MVSQAIQQTDQEELLPPEKLETALQICEAIAETPKGLAHICSSDDRFPTRKTFHEWLLKSKTLRDKYACARLLQADILVEECLDIADDSSGDTKLVGREGEEHEVCDTEFVQRSRVRIDTRKWLASKLAPRKYGDKVTTELTGANGGPVAVIAATIDASQAAEAYRKLMQGDE